MGDMGRSELNCATPTSGFCAPVAARLNVNLEQDVDFCPGLSKSQDTNLAGIDAQGPAECGIWGENPSVCALS